MRVFYLKSWRKIIFFIAVVLFIVLIHNFRKSFHKVNVTKEVQIWGKAEISDYLWLHLLQASTTISKNGVIRTGSITIDGIQFKYYTGPGYLKETMPQTVKHLILVLNGETEEHVRNTKSWLDYLPKLINLKKLAVILLGDEECDNNWISSYLKSKGGLIDLLFVVYDSPLVDDKEVFQWPLGVLMYNNFPNIKSNQVNLQVRKYKCNFLRKQFKGYTNHALSKILNNDNFNHKCKILDSNIWPHIMTDKTLNNYIEILNSSDFTLCPSGLNAESYQIYEAMSLGSIPIVEDKNSYGYCVLSLRLLKQYNPPIIFIKKWGDLNDILYDENSILIYNQRMDIIEWYHSFKLEMAKRFLKLVQERFFLQY